MRNGFTVSWDSMMGPNAKIGLRKDEARSLLDELHNTGAMNMAVTTSSGSRIQSYICAVQALDSVRFG